MIRRKVPVDMIEGLEEDRGLEHGVVFRVNKSAPLKEGVWFAVGGLREMVKLCFFCEDLQEYWSIDKGRERGQI